MSRPPRVPKSELQRLQECETHLHFLSDALEQYETEPDRFKQVAAELRVLVCKAGSNQPRLLDLMDQYGFSYLVMPRGMDGGPPLLPQPLPMVGWRDDPDHLRLTELAAGDKATFEQFKAEAAALARPVPFRDWVDRGLAVFIAPYDYSNGELVLAIAQQFGSSHEDDSVDEPIVRMQQIRIGGESSDVAALNSFARLTLSIGRLFLDHVSENHAYTRRYPTSPDHR